MRYEYTLLTNLNYVHIGSVRTHTKALLLERAPFPFHHSVEAACQARGFGTDPTWPVFSFPLSSIEYTLSDPESPHMFITCFGNSRPLMSCVQLHIKDSPDIILSIEDRQKPLDIQQFAFDDSLSGLDEVWETLTVKVRDYWNAPRMPRLLWERLHRIESWNKGNKGTDETETDQR